MMHYASKRNWDSIPAIILDIFIVNINVQDHYGKTPLHHSICNRNHESMTLLLTHNDIQLCIQDYQGNPALHYSTDLAYPDYI